MTEKQDKIGPGNKDLRGSCAYFHEAAWRFFGDLPTIPVGHQRKWYTDRKGRFTYIDIECPKDDG